MARELVNIVKDDNRNALINGGFDFWQRGTSFTPIADSSYGADRWQFVTSDGTANVTQEEFVLGQTEVPGNPLYYLRYDVTTGNDFCRMIQKIEDARTFAGKTISVSFWAKGTNPGGGKLEVSFDRSFDLTVSTDFAIVGAQDLVLTSSWARYTYVFNIPAVPPSTTLGLSSALIFRIGQGADASTDAWQLDIANVMIHEGNAPREFERAGRNEAEELQLCKRFYQKSYSLLANPGSITSAGKFVGNFVRDGSRLNYAHIRLTVDMYLIPSVTIYDPQATNQPNSYRNETDNIRYPGSADGINRTSFNVLPDGSTGITIGDVWEFHWVADGEL